MQIIARGIFSVESTIFLLGKQTEKKKEKQL